MVALQGVTGIPEAQSIAGKNEWASRFHDKGAPRLGVSTYQVLACAGHQRSKHALFKEKAIQDLQETCERITMKRAFIADPVFNFAEDQISADASTSFGCGIQENKYWAGRTARVRNALSIRIGYQVLRWLRHSLYVVVRNQEKFNVVYRAKHIATFKNTVPDMLSKNKIEEAMALTRERWGKAYLFEVPTEMRQRWLEDEDRVVKAASH